jgi:hypothetical protein
MLLVPLLVLAGIVLAIAYSARHQHAQIAGTGAMGGQVSPVAHRHAQLSLWALAAIPLSVIAGVAVVLALVGDPNAATAPQRWDNAWRVTLAWILMILPSVVGFSFGVRAVREGDSLGRAGLVLNALVVLFFTVVTLLGGILDGF